MTNATQPASGRFLHEDLPYILPMAAFLLLTWAGGYWPAFLPASYVIKTLLSAALLLWFWRRYTPIRWNHAWLGVLVGIIGIVQWVGMEKLLLHLWPNYWRPAATIFDPYQYFTNPLWLWSFTIIRWAGAALMVPFMEELFWRDYLWRTVLAPNDFKLVSVGEWDWKSLLFIAALFATVHIQWMTAFVWGLMIGGLLIYTRSLGACIIAHAITNFLLGGYVQYTRDWYFW